MTAVPPTFDSATLAEHVELIDVATVEDLDELLEDLLIRSYPTKLGQDS